MPNALLRPNTPPPADYYRDNLLRVIEFVAQRYGDALVPPERAWFAALTAASRMAQRTYARLITRKGPYLRIDRLAYAEIPDIAGCIEELILKGLVDLLPEAPADRLLAGLTKRELATCFALNGNVRKAAMIDEALGRFTDASIRRRIARHYPWLALAQPHMLRLAHLLYFGDVHQDATVFVLEDLGMVRYESYPLAARARRFADRAALERHLELRRLHALAHRADECTGLAAVVRDQLWPEPHDRYDRRVRDRALNQLGLWFERAGLPGEALECYGRSGTPPARERRVRILARLGDTGGSARLLARLREAPASVVERDFGERFGRRGAGVRPPTCVRELAGAVPGSIERHAMEDLAREGADCWHVENALPRTLAALAFWDVVYAPVAGAFVNPYQTGPVDLFWPDFARARAGLIEVQRARLATPEGFAEVVHSVFTAKRAVANALATWQWLDEATLARVIQTIPHELLLALVTRVIQDPQNTRTGFPDLLVMYGNTRYEFVEVKGPNDQLQPAQRMWFEFLLAHGFPARVLRYRA